MLSYMTESERAELQGISKLPSKWFCSLDEAPLERRAG